LSLPLSLDMMSPMKKLLATIILSFCFITPSQANNNHKNIVKVRWCQPYEGVQYAFPINAERVDYCKHKQFSYKEVMNLPIMQKRVQKVYKGKWKNNYFPLCYKINVRTLYSENGYQTCAGGGAILLEYDGENYYYIGEKVEPLPRAKDDTRNIDYALDEITLNKLLKSAKDFREGRITESEFDRVKDDILKTL